jgi:hypothetical protein
VSDTCQCSTRLTYDAKDGRRLCPFCDLPKSQDDDLRLVSSLFAALDASNELVRLASEIVDRSLLICCDDDHAQVSGDTSPCKVCGKPTFAELGQERATAPPAEAGGAE